ncbi:hypothetical protein BH11ARM2_BH11ARM2_27330 [soil metagenome]
MAEGWGGIWAVFPRSRIGDGNEEAYHTRFGPFADCFHALAKTLSLPGAEIKAPENSEDDFMARLGNAYSDRAVLRAFVDSDTYLLLAMERSNEDDPATEAENRADRLIQGLPPEVRLFPFSTETVPALPSDLAFPQSFVADLSCGRAVWPVGLFLSGRRVARPIRLYTVTATDPEMTDFINNQLPLVLVPLGKIAEIDEAARAAHRRVGGTLSRLLPPPERDAVVGLSVEIILREAESSEGELMRTARDLANAEIDAQNVETNRLNLEDRFASPWFAPSREKWQPQLTRTAIRAFRQIRSDQARLREAMNHTDRRIEIARLCAEKKVEGQAKTAANLLGALGALGIAGLVPESLFKDAPMGLLAVRLLVGIVFGFLIWLFLNRRPA